MTLPIAERAGTYAPASTVRRVIRLSAELSNEGQFNLGAHVAPSNIQVNRLKQVLPEGARVGTVDKFQGQDAEAVLVSMTTSSGEYLPRDIDFLYSKNRLNVAISRARCWVGVVASPRLLDVSVKSAVQMALVNTLCWAQEYSNQ